MSDSPDSGEVDEWHEDARVAATRLVCQLIVTLSVLVLSVVLILTHPEYNAGIALVCGVVLGTWFAIPSEFRRRRRPKRRKDDED